MSRLENGTGFMGWDTRRTRARALTIGCVGIATIGFLVVGGMAPWDRPGSAGAAPAAGHHAPHRNARDCKTILVIVDSMAGPVGRALEALYAESGRCATVVERAVGGTAVTDWLPGATYDARGPLDEVRPDFVIVHFVGNWGIAGPSWGDPAWLDRTTSGALTIIDEARAVGAGVYWAIPPRTPNCRGDWLSADGARVQLAWHHWIQQSLTTLRPAVHLLDWRTPFGGDTYSQLFRYPDGTVHALRTPDCLHFSDEGVQIAARATVAGTQQEWPHAHVAVSPPVTGTPIPGTENVPLPPILTVPASLVSDPTKLPLP